MTKGPLTLYAPLISLPLSKNHNTLLLHPTDTPTPTACPKICLGPAHCMCVCVCPSLSLEDPFIHFLSSAEERALEPLLPTVEVVQTKPV